MITRNTDKTYEYAVRHLDLIRFMCRGAVILLLVFLSIPAIAENENRDRINETSSIKVIEGRVDSVRPDKIIITYEPEDQPGSELQTYYKRDMNTAFTERGENELAPGDMVEITFEEKRWENSEGNKRAERVAKSIGYVRSKAEEQVRKAEKKAKKDKETKVDSRNSAIEDMGPQ